MNYKELISQRIKEKFSIETMEDIVSSTGDKGDFSLPCFKFAKTLRTSPQNIASEFASAFTKEDPFSKVETVAGYVNFFVAKSVFAKDALSEILSAGTNFGKSGMGKNRNVVIDYSSVNIAKPFHIGHLSTTVLGSSLYKVFNFLGFNAVGVNHLGDWGTQFGKLITAYRLWGDREKIEKGGVLELTKIYIKFHQEAEKDKSLEDDARANFKAIEDGDTDALALFDWFKEITMKEVSEIYEILGVQFDSYKGESFYNDKMSPVVSELEEKGLLKTSEGAKIVDLEEFKMPPCLILRSDGATLYATRDLAAAEYRYETYDFYKCLYVVAYQQNLHFSQVFKVLELMEKPYAKDLVHVAFGMVSYEGESLSTRKGNMVALRDVLAKSCEKAKEIILKKNPDMENVDKISKTIGIGAVVFFALSNSRIKDIDFSYEKALAFEGESGPYVQYTATRCSSLLKKAEEIQLQKMEELTTESISFDKISPEEFEHLKLLHSFKDTLKDVIEKYEPSYISRKILDISKSFNKFYYDKPILKEEDEGVRALRLGLTKATHHILKRGLNLLGIEIPEKM